MLKADERTKHIPVVALTGHALAGASEAHGRPAAIHSSPNRACPDDLVVEVRRMLRRGQEHVTIRTVAWRRLRKQSSARKSGGALASVREPRAVTASRAACSTRAGRRRRRGARRAAQSRRKKRRRTHGGYARADARDRGARHRDARRARRRARAEAEPCPTSTAPARPRPLRLLHHPREPAARSSAPSAWTSSGPTSTRSTTRTWPAVVSDVPIAPLDSTRENVLAHERVNETVMRDHTVIPMSFGTDLQDARGHRRAAAVGATMRSPTCSTRCRTSSSSVSRCSGIATRSSARSSSEDEDIHRLKTEISSQKGSTYFAADADAGG